MEEKMKERLEQLKSNPWATILMALVVGALFISMIGVPNPEVGMRSGEQPEPASAIASEDSQKEGWWAQNNGGKGRSW